jgi:NADPH:quinone reductase-like Zn-dependent oxidoreductase
MKAIVIDDYGGVDQLHLRELPDPRPHADEILVRVGAAGVNPVDWKIRQGQLRFIVRPNFPFIPGGDIASDVSRWRGIGGAMLHLAEFRVLAQRTVRASQ